MVSALQSALETCIHNKDHNNEFLARLALAKRLPGSNQIKTCLALVTKEHDPSEIISLIFQATTIEFEKCVPIIDQCQLPEYRARAYCLLSTHLPNERDACLKGALRNAAGIVDVYGLYCHIARTFQSEEAAKKIPSASTRAIVFFEICLQSLEADSGKAQDIVLHCNPSRAKTGK